MIRVSQFSGLVRSGFASKFSIVIVSSCFVFHSLRFIDNRLSIRPFVLVLKINLVYFPTTPSLTQLEFSLHLDTNCCFMALALIIIFFFKNPFARSGSDCLFISRSGKTSSSSRVGKEQDEEQHARRRHFRGAEEIQVMIYVLKAVDKMKALDKPKHCCGIRGGNVGMNY